MSTPAATSSTRAHSTGAVGPPRGRAVRRSVGALLSPTTATSRRRAGCRSITRPYRLRRHRRLDRDAQRLLGGGRGARRRPRWRRRTAYRRRATRSRGSGWRPRAAGRSPRSRGRTPARLGVQLKRDGSYLVVPYEDAEDSGRVPRRGGAVPLAGAAAGVACGATAARARCRPMALNKRGRVARPAYRALDRPERKADRQTAHLAAIVEQLRHMNEGHHPGVDRSDETGRTRKRVAALEANR